MANSQDGARLDVRAQGFWGDAFFDVRVFNPLAPSNRWPTLPQCFRSHEREKRRAYEQRVREVEHDSFTPLAFAATGGMGKAANITCARIVSNCGEERAALQPGDWMATLCAELQSVEISHHVPWWYPCPILCKTSQLPD